MQQSKKLFSHLNQKTDGYRMGCPIYSAVINLKYNCGIELNKTDIDEIIKVCKTKGFRDKKAGGYGKSCFNEVFNYAVKKNPNLTYSIFDNKTPNTDFMFDKEYMLTIGISVNDKWLIDKKDGKIDSKEYSEFKGTKFKHFTNIMKWTTGNDIGDYCYDSYFGKEDNLYKINFKEIKDIMMNGIFFFYLK